MFNRDDMRDSDEEKDDLLSPQKQKRSNSPDSDGLGEIGDFITGAITGVRRPSLSKRRRLSARKEDLDMEKLAQSRDLPPLEPLSESRDVRA